MDSFSSHRRQRGYLLEVPILFMIVAVAVAILLPKLPPVGQKILVAVAAIPILLCLFYMIVTPGWTPGGSGRLRPPWSWIVFILVAGVIIAGVLAIIFSR